MAVDPAPHPGPKLCPKPKKKSGPKPGSHIVSPSYNFNIHLHVIQTVMKELK